ncbi:MAG: NmrA family NAD(P)-binding protein [Bacteroidales bacterium]
MKKYAITGATGNTGKSIAIGLLTQGHEVRIISRSSEKAKEFTDMGAKLFQGDTAQVDLLKKAFDVVDAVYAMVPFNMHAPDYFAFQMSHVNAMKEALEANHTPYAVTLSSIGIHLKAGAGVVQGLQRMEEAFDTIPGLNVMHLRAAYFMENTLAQVGAIKHMGAMGSPVNGDMSFPIVATRDISEMAINFLTTLDFKGNNYEYVLGPRDVTYHELAQVFGKAIGKPDLQY